MIYVCSLHEMPSHARYLRPGYLISLIQPEFQPPTPDEVPIERHLRIAVDDVSQEAWGAVIPEEEHIQNLVAFLDQRNREEGVLIHCYAGISRSTAAALIALVIDMDGQELEAARILRRAAPHAKPNQRIIALADQILGRQGRLVAAREAMGPAELAYEAPLVTVAPTPAGEDAPRGELERWQ